MRRRIFCASGLAALASSAFADEPPRDVTAAEDFDELWSTLRERYCYFGEKHTDWDRVRTMYRPLAIAAGDANSPADFIDVVGGVLRELYDAHTHLSDPPDGAPRWPMFDLLVERQGREVRIADMRGASEASEGGLRIGDTIATVNGTPIDDAAAAVAPKCLSTPDPAADAYAINVAVAGRRAQARTFTIRSRGATRTIALPHRQFLDLPDLDSRLIESGIGYIHIRSFANTDTIAAFDIALATFREAPGLVLDARDNGGGDTAVARPIMGRFISTRRPYALMRRRDGVGLSAPWTEYVDPRGPFTYDKPIVVLTNRWSGSMAEGFPMGMRDIGRARIVGTPMMGLGAGVVPLRLDRTALQAQYSAEPVYDLTDRPRSRLRPDIETAPGSDVLAAGLRELHRMIASAH
jgi:carboxyl-terminal processing protease